MSEDQGPVKIEIPPTGVHVLPLMSSPDVLANLSKPAFAQLVVVELTPHQKGVPTKARCQIPMRADAAIQLAILILKFAGENEWPLPQGTPTSWKVQ